MNIQFIARMFITGIVVCVIAAGVPLGIRTLHVDKSTDSAPRKAIEINTQTTPSDESSPQQTPVEAPNQSKPVEVGPVVPDDSVAELERPVEPGAIHTKDGAVAAFTSLATWLVASPAVREEPELAIDEVGGSMLNSTDAAMLEGMVRSSNDDFSPSKGGYRILGYSGDESKPDQVMTEVVAPLRTESGTRWAIVGGVVRWSEGSWHLMSIAPRELEKQPQDSQRTAKDMSAGDQSVVFDGLGWRLFSNSGE